MQAKSSITYRGIDISNNTGNVDLIKLKSAGIQAVYIKATEGTTYKDAYFNSFVNGLKANNIPFGCYHYLRLTSGLEDQAVEFWSTIKDSGYSLVPVVDIESEIFHSAQVKTFLDKFEQLSGIKAAIYASSCYIAENFDASLLGYKLWLADYNAEPGDNGIWQSYDAWQYTSTGSVDGINGAVDLDLFCDTMFLSQPSGQTAEPVKSAPADNGSRVAPPFPLGNGQYFGPEGGGDNSISGYHSHRDDLRCWQQRMHDRGWAITVDGLYGPEGAETPQGNTADIARKFQQEKALTADALIGPQTWVTAWTAPIT